jgi:hypothetical protein
VRPWSWIWRVLVIALIAVAAVVVMYVPLADYSFQGDFCIARFPMHAPEGTSGSTQMSLWPAKTKCVYEWPRHKVELSYGPGVSWNIEVLVGAVLATLLLVAWPRFRRHLWPSQRFDRRPPIPWV